MNHSHGKNKTKQKNSVKIFFKDSFVVSIFDFSNEFFFFLISLSGHRLGNFFIEVMKSCQQKAASICHYQERPLNETTTFQCNPHMIGQYVRIRTMDAESHASTRNDLTLCEVEVQGVAIGIFKLCFLCHDWCNKRSWYLSLSMCDDAYYRILAFNQKE